MLLTAITSGSFLFLFGNRFVRFLRTTFIFHPPIIIKLAITFGELVYNGKWFSPLREALSAFVDKTQEHVTGTVRLKLYKGNMINAGVWSPYSLYSEDIATFGESDYDQKDAQGFINLYGLSTKVQAMVNAKLS